MNAEQKRKIHKWLCIGIFTIMNICAGIVAANTYIWQNEELAKALQLTGIMLETPLLIMFIKYMWDYHRLKKEQK